MRTAGQPLPRLFVVKPDGRIVGYRYAKGIGGGENISVVGYHERSRRPFIREWALEKGYIMLEKAYAADSREQVRAEGFERYIEFERAAREGRLPNKPTGDPTRPEGVQMNWAKFPDEWLPEEVIRRREGKSDVSEKKWEAPKAPKATKVASA